MEELRTNPAQALAKYKTKASADKLAKMLQEASDAYYNRGESLLTDDIFDMAKDHLTKIAPTHPFLKQIGAPVAGEKVTLPYWMGSMDKIRDDAKALEKWVAKYPGGYVVSDKLDGNSAMMVLNTNGKFIMYSRGDGKVGQDISHLLPHIQGVPSPQGLEPGTAVRGELIISKENWKKIAHLGANARNVVAGALHRKTPDIKIAKHIEFVAYDLVSPRTHKPSVALAQLQDRGFIVVHRRVLEDTNVTMDALSKLLMRRRQESPYECDGIIVHHDALHKLVAGSNPKYAFAFKSIHTHEEAEVVVSQVEWNVSKDGYIKPTVHFSPVTLTGVKIQRATGFNGAFIESNKIGPGSRVVIIRSGDVIPYIVRVLTPSASGTAQMPEVAYGWNDTHVDLVVVAKDGAEQRLRTLEHFAKTLDIPHVAVGTLKKLVAAGFDTIPRLLSIMEADLLKLDGFKEASARKVATSLKHVKATATCVQMMAASNIFGRGFGEKKLQMIIKELPKILERHLPTLEELKAIEGIGPATAAGFHNGMRAFFDLMDEIGMPCRMAATEDHGVAPLTKTQKSVKGMSIVFTGFRAKEWEKHIEAMGGKVAAGVTKTTSLVVAVDPNESSGKLDKARSLGISIISKNEFAKEYMGENPQ